MKFIIVNITYKGILKLVLLFQTLKLIAQRPIVSIYEKTKKYLLIINGEPKGLVYPTRGIYGKGTSISFPFSLMH